MPLGITVGVIGAGKIEKRNAHALLRDWVDARGGTAKFVVPMTKAHWNPGLAIVCDYAAEHGMAVEAVVDDTTSRLKEVKPYLTQARKQHQSAAPVTKLVALLEAGRKPHLLVLWDDEDEDALQALMKAETHEIPMFDLTRGMDPVLLTDEEPPVTEPEEEPEEEPEGEPEDEEETTGEADEPPDDEEPLPDFADLMEDEPLALDEENDVSSTLTEFETRLLDVLERLADHLGPPAPVAVEKPARTVQKAAQKPAAAKKAPTPKAPASKLEKAARAPKKAKPEANGEMSKAEAQRIIDAYVPRRGRPPADVTAARKVLGLIP